MTPKLKSLATEWLSKPEVHAEFHHNPVKYVEERGIHLSEAEKMELINLAKKDDSKIERIIKTRLQDFKKSA